MKETPLIRCAHNGHLQAVKMLVARGADVNALDLVRYHGNGYIAQYCAGEAVASCPQAGFNFLSLRYTSLLTAGGTQLSTG